MLLALSMVLVKVLCRMAVLRHFRPSDPAGFGLGSTGRTAPPAGARFADILVFREAFSSHPCSVGI